MPKVCELHTPLARDQNVVWLDVPALETLDSRPPIRGLRVRQHPPSPVHKTATVSKFDRVEELADYALGVCLAEVF